ncbi:MAG: type II toxin-antitoxin system VapC family toxin [Candidatus Korobacteraceae bacterium]
MSIYADSSFFVSLYLIDGHSREAEQRMAKRPRLWLTPLHRAEWTHAVAQHVFRRTISNDEARQFYSAFEADRERGLWLDVEMPDRVFERCVEIARQHGPTLGGSTLDTLHIASALELGAERFWTFDERQAKLARAAGLKS